MKLDTKVLLTINNNNIDLEKKNMLTNHMHRIVSVCEYGSSDWYTVLILCLRLKSNIETENKNETDRYLNMIVDEIGNNQDVTELRKCLDT